MGKEAGMHFSIKGAIESVKRKLGKVNPVAASVEGPVLTEEEERRARFRASGRLFTKRSVEDASNIPQDQRIPFGDITEHRKRRGLR